MPTMVSVGDTWGRAAHSKFAIAATALWLLATLMLGTLLIPASASGAAKTDAGPNSGADPGLLGASGNVSADVSADVSSTASVDLSSGSGSAGDTVANDPANATPITVYYGNDPAQYYLAWLPPHPTSKTAVALLHGGFWISGSPSQLASLNRKLYAAGIPSFSIGYRLATAARWPAQRTDTEAAIDSIKTKADQFGINPKKVALIGSSAGGHLALAVASGAGSSDICAAVTYSAPTSMNVIRSDGAGDYRRQLLATASNRLAPTPGLTRSATLPVTPSRSDAPALLFAGQSEWMPYLQSSLYVQAYKGTGLDVRPVILSGVSAHAMRYVVSVPLVWRLTTQFIDQHC